MTRDNRQVKISIDLAAIRHNLKRVRHYAPKARIFSVLKSDAYGHGALRILPALSNSDGFAVASVAEGVDIRNTGEVKPILVLQGFHSVEQLRQCANAGLWPVLHHHEQLSMIDAVKLAVPLSGSWIKVDTGMGRLGFKPDEVARLFIQLSRKGVQVRGLLTHFSSADRSADMATDRQLRVFRKVNYSAGIERSASNSAAVLTRSDSDFDWVRPGLMLYGADPLEYRSGLSGNVDFGLQPAMRVTAPVIAVRELNRGDRIGYGGTYECKQKTRVAIVAAGYGDGYPRSVQPGTCVMLGSRRSPIVGRVSMDSISVDITGLSVAPPLDYPVTLWGHENLRVDEVADRAGTIPYELLCSIRGKRSWHDPATEVSIRTLK